MIGLDVRHVADVPVASPLEDVDAANAALLSEELAACSTSSGSDRLVLDLSHTRYVDSAGIDMIFRLAERLRERRARLLVVIPESSQLFRLAEIVSLPSVVSMHANVAEALEAAEAAD